MGRFRDGQLGGGFRNQSNKRIHFGPCRRFGGRFFSFWEELVVKASLAVLVALLSVAVQAQPQAPIEWGDVQVIYNNPQWPAAGVTAQGDTIVLHSFRLDTAYYHVALSVSGNGGQSWSPWQVFTEERNSSLNSYTAITPWGILCATVHYRPSQTAGLSRSTDLGWTWQDPCSFQPIGGPLVLQGDTLFCRYRAYGVKWTDDAGCSFSDSFGTGLPSDAAFESMAVGGGWVHVLATRTEHGRGRVLYYTRAPLATGVFEAPRDLLPDIYWTQNGHVECDEEGTVMVLAPINYHPPLPWLVAQMVSMSRDYGATWTERDTLTPVESADYTDEEIVRDDHRWFAVWIDSTASPGFPDGGLRCKFSANRGRSWYPSQQIEGQTEHMNGVADIDLQLSVVKVYSAGDQYLFNRWQGTIDVDSVPPAFSSIVELPLLVRGDTLLLVGITGSDNDSLWQARFIAFRAGSNDSVVIPLLRQDSTFTGMWQVPDDSVDWFYSYEAEDMWEHIATWPEDGPLLIHIGPLSSSDDFIPHPSSLRLSVFPNPFNSTTHLEFALPSTQRVSLRLCDVLGREAAVLMNEIKTAGEHRLTFDASGLPSGVYLCRLEAGEMAQTRKLVLLK